MRYFHYSDSPYPIRDDIAKAHAAFWDRLAGPGCWWSGSQRIAIAQESRNAVGCSYCDQRRNAPSPYNFPGKHTSDSGLHELAVDAVHRIISDQTRITQAYVDSNVERGLSNEAYVELAGIVVAVFSIDEFHRGLGLPLEVLPAARVGEPSQYRPSKAVAGTGFVPMLPVDGAVGDESDLWENRQTANVLRALTLVPDALRDWMQIGSAQYLSMQGMANMLKHSDRSINRMQMELVAARVSVINECFY